MSLEDFQEFQDDVRREVEAASGTNEFLWNDGKVKVGRSQVMNLHNMIDNWKKQEKASRRNIVRKHVSGLVQGEASKDKPLDFDSLALRVYDFEGLKQAPFLITYPIGENLAVALVQDLPDSVVTVKKEIAEQSGKSLEELYTIAQDNLVNKIKHDTNRIESPYGPITDIHAEVYGGAFIALMRRMAEPGVRYMIASPTRDQFMFFRPNLWNQESANVFLQICTKFSKSSPRYYIYPFILAFQDGEYTDLCEFVDGEMHFKSNVTFDE